MRLIAILLLALCIGIWFSFSLGTLCMVILSVVSLYLFSLNFKEPAQKRFIISVCILALSLRFLFSIFNYYFSWARGIGADFIGDARAYSASGQYIAEVLTEERAINIDGNEFQWVISLREMYKGLLPGLQYRVDIFGRYVGLIYSSFGYSPVLIKFINSLLSVLSSILLFIIARKYFSTKVANIALVLTLFWPSTTLWSVTGLKDPLLIFLITLNIFIYLQYFKDEVDNFEFAILFSILAIRNHFSSIVFLFIFTLYRIVKIVKSRSSVLNTIIIPLILVMVMKTSIDFLELLRSHLAIFLLVALLFSRILLLNKKQFITLLILICLGLFNISSSSKFNIKELYSCSTRSLINHQRLQLDSAESAYKVYPDKYYGSKLDISYFDLAPSYLKGLSYVLFSPFPSGNLRNISGFLSIVQSLIFYILVPFTILGIFISLRYKWRDMSIFILFIVITFSAYALLEGNVGTVFRHRDVAMFFLLMFTAIGIDRLFESNFLSDDR